MNFLNRFSIGISWGMTFFLKEKSCIFKQQNTIIKNQAKQEKIKPTKWRFLVIDQTKKWWGRGQSSLLSNGLWKSILKMEHQSNKLIIFGSNRLTRYWSRTNH